MKKIRFLPYTKEHDEKTVQWLNDPSVAEGFGLTKQITVASHRKWIEKQTHYYIWAVYDELDHRGNVALTHNPHHYSAYFQMYIGDPEARGKGLGYSALLFAIKYAFEVLQVHRLWLHVFPDNESAIHLYEKVGFQQEGIEREAHYFNGKFRDQVIYSILKQEWEKGELE